jgi:hypothetical protein
MDLNSHCRDRPGGGADAFSPYLSAMDDADLQVRPVTEATWPDLERLFEGRGGPKYCWCMAWRALENRSSARPEQRKLALRQRVKAETPVGLIGYVAHEPAA